MNPSQILEHKHTAPFLPFRVHMSDGSAYDVPHPDFIGVSRTQIAVAIWGNAKGEVPERFVYLDPLHVTRIEPLSKAKPGNGEAKRRKKGS